MQNTKHTSKDTGLRGTRCDRDELIESDVISRCLAAHGDQFMQLFEDDPPHPTGGAACGSAVPCSSSDSGPADSSASESGDACGEGSEYDEDRGNAAVEYIFNSVAVLPQGRRQPGGTKGGSRQAPALDEKLERRRFMSHKAAVVSSPKQATLSVKKSGSADKVAAEEEGMSRKDFQAMQREVQLYGAGALDRKARKQFDSALLLELGAKPQKGPRISAAIGLGMAKKQAQREAASRQEAIAAGMLKVKGTGKKKRREKQAALGWGLGEDGGATRGGVMRVKGAREGKAKRPAGKGKQR